MLRGIQVSIHCKLRRSKVLHLSDLLPRDLTWFQRRVAANTILPVAVANQRNGIQQVVTAALYDLFPVRLHPRAVDSPAALTTQISNSGLSRLSDYWRRCTTAPDRLRKWRKILESLSSHRGFEAHMGDIRRAIEQLESGGNLKAAFWNVELPDLEPWLLKALQRLGEPSPSRIASAAATVLLHAERWTPVNELMTEILFERTPNICDFPHCFPCLVADGRANPMRTATSPDVLSLLHEFNRLCEEEPNGFLAMPSDGKVDNPGADLIAVGRAIGKARRLVLLFEVKDRQDTSATEWNDKIALLQESAAVRFFTDQFIFVAVLAGRCDRDFRAAA